MWNNTWFRRIVLAISGTGVLVFLICKIVHHEYNNTTITEIDRDFDGLNKSFTLNEDDKTLRLLIVHGIGRHCIGYSDLFMNKTAEKMGLDISKTPLLNNLIATLDIERAQKLGDFLQENDLDLTGLRNILDKVNSEGKFDQKSDQDIFDKYRQLQIKQGISILPLVALDSKNRCNLIKPTATDYPIPDSYYLKNYEDPQTNALNNTCKRIKYSQQGKNYNNHSCQQIVLRFKNPVDENKDPSPFTFGYIRTQDYYKQGQPKNSNPALRIYELTWDPSTRWAKTWYKDHDKGWDQEHPRYERYWVNEKIKVNTINESISDAVMYIGDYQPLIQFPIHQAYCKVATDKLKIEKELDYTFRCPIFKDEDPNVIPDWKDFAQKNSISIISHSLGTRIVFDTLGQIGKETKDNNFLTEIVNKLESEHRADINDIDPEKGEKIRKIFASGLESIFALTNQVPLIELSEIKYPDDYGTNYNKKDSDIDSHSRDLGLGFNSFLQLRKDLSEAKSLQINSFSDPDDLLSYHLKCWYYLHVLRYKDHAKEIKKEYKKKYGEGKSRDFDANLFKEVCSSEEISGEWKSYHKKLWDEEEKLLKMTDVVVSLQGWSIPLLFTYPGNAHSYFREIEEITSLIACGGESNIDEADTPKDCKQN